MKNFKIIPFFMFLVFFSIQRINTSTTSFSHPNIERNVVSDNDSTRHYIGELFGGGVVFWVDPTGQHGLICSMTDIKVHPYSYQEIPLPKGENKIMTKHNAKSAAKLCENYTNSDFGTGIFSDWFLPDRDQLWKLRNSKLKVNTTIATFSDDGKGLLRTSGYAVYWSSSTHFSELMGRQNILLDFSSEAFIRRKEPIPGRLTLPAFVRAIRAF
jgi:hypothetical protein